MAMSEVHALLIPFAAEGHINGLLRLAQALAAQGLTLTFGYPARSYNLATKRLKGPNALLVHPSIRIEVLPDGLPTAENEAPTPQQFMNSIPILKDAVKLLIKKLTDISDSNTVPICCIISDTFVPWTQDMADEAGLPRVDFWTSTATVYSMAYHVPQLISRGHLPVKGGETQWTVDADLIDFIPGLPPFPVTELPREFLLDTSHPMFQFLTGAFSRVKEADTILVHSLHELESSVVEALQAEGIPIHCVGPLFGSDPVSTNSENGTAASKPACLEWLDEQAVSSVVYVALGTVATLTHEETHALALGLEASGQPFLWVIRADSMEGTLTDMLPEGFLERTKGRCHVVSWAPQREVLKHGAVGAFLTHCGWNSTLESLWEGVPMVACPRAAEQRSNSRSIVERWKVGVELDRNIDGTFTKEGVEKAVRTIMSDQSVRQRAIALKIAARRTVSEGGTSHLHLLNFVNRLQHLRHQSLT